MLTDETVRNSRYLDLLAEQKESEATSIRDNDVNWSERSDSL